LTTESGAEWFSDEMLLAGSVERPERFVTFYDRHSRRLLAFFARRTFDPQVAADLTAETFAQAFAGRSGFRNPGPGAAAAWLYTIAHRQLSQFIRRQCVESLWRVRMGIDPQPVSAEAIERAEELLDLQEVREQVALALDTLKGELREAMTLRVVDGRSYAEAARLIGCDETLVRQRVSRGLKKLARRLRVFGEDHE
jgi:RNA polymerase sigma factor (sigma-70 family)